MAIPIRYNLRSLRERPMSTLGTAIGMGLVVAVFIAVMALAAGFRAALVKTGSRDNVMLLRDGADSELSSGISRETAQTIAALPFVATGADGQPLMSPEVYVVINIPRIGKADVLANVVARGVSARAFDVRKDIRIVEGRRFEPGASEIIVGKTTAERFEHCGVGDQLHFANRDWTVVGHFTAGGSAFDSEIWGENEQFMPAFRGEVFQSVTFRMKDPSAFDAVKKAIEDDPRLHIDAAREYDFYANQSRELAALLQVAGSFVTGIMALGAIFGAVNTMDNMVSSRSREIAVLLTLGFRPRSVLLSFFLEALMIAVLGGLLGCLIALPINGIVTSTTNWSSFSEIAFEFRVTPGILARGMIFAVVMGVLGGLLPARHAARQPIVQALRRA